MPLSTDTLLDRLQLKHQITRWRIVAVLAIVLALVIVIERNQSISMGDGRDFIARIQIDGIILDDLKREQLLTEIKQNPHAKALLIRMDTPGGSAVAGQELYEQLRDISAVKPVVILMRNLSASAGYLAALGADHILARDGTLTGSIGVIVQTVEATELIDKIGLKPVIIKTGPLKDALAPYREVTPEAREMMQGVVNDFYDVFVDIIAKRRKIPKQEVIKLADGRIFSGRQAVRLNLIDGLGAEDEAMAWLQKEKEIQKGILIRDLKKKEDPLPFIDHLISTTMQKIMPGSTGSLDGLVSIWHPNLQIQ